jgi:hypothetical protein
MSEPGFGEGEGLSGIEWTRIILIALVLLAGGTCLSILIVTDRAEFKTKYTIPQQAAIYLGAIIFALFCILLIVTLFGGLTLFKRFHGRLSPGLSRQK